MGRIAIITDDPGWHGKQLRLAFAHRGYGSTYVSLTECRFSIAPGRAPLIIPGFDHKLPDAVFVRGVPGGSLEEVVLYLDILHALQIMNIPVYNDGRAIERSVDKGMTSFLLHHAGLPTPLTWVLRDRAEALNIAEAELKKGHQLISKPLFGSQGEGIRRLEKMTDLFWLTDSRGVYYLQRFVHCAGNGFSDHRVFVINGQAVAAMRRRGKSWLNNVAQGASCEMIDSDSEMARLAVKSTETLAMDYAGVDIMLDKEGSYTVIEVNSIPAWKGLQSVCDVNIAGLLADDFIGRRIEKIIMAELLLFYDRSGQLRELYITACEIELEAFKPGNVSVYSGGHDMTVADFRISAEVSAGPLCNPDYSLGEKIYYAVKATRERVGCNTNLGIVLLCAPMIQAGFNMSSEMTLRQALSQVIAGTTVEDANWVFNAITLAAPGGLGRSGEQDVRGKATVTLLESMKIAAGIDRIAFQYSTDYEDIFEFSMGLYYNAIRGRIGRIWATVAVYAGLLSRFPDSHIERKYGDRYSGMVAARMALLSEELDKGDSPEQTLPLLYQIDQEFKSKGINPGTTADLTVATILTVLLEDIICNYNYSS